MTRSCRCYRPHSAGRWGAKAIAACAFVALIVAAGSFSNVWLPEKWSATDLHAALDPLTAQDTKTNPDISLNVAEGGHPMAQWKLGRMYADGDGVAQDDVRPSIFSRIANAHAKDSPSAPQAQIVANAFVALGRYYLNGIPNSKIKPDPDGRGRCSPMPQRGQPVQNRLEIDVSPWEGLRRQSSNKSRIVRDSGCEGAP